MIHYVGIPWNVMVVSVGIRLSMDGAFLIRFVLLIPNWIQLVELFRQLIVFVFRIISYWRLVFARNVIYLVLLVLDWPVIIVLPVQPEPMPHPEYAPTMAPIPSYKTKLQDLELAGLTMLHLQLQE